MFGSAFSKENERLAVKLQDDAILSALRAGKNVIVDNTHLHKGNAGMGPQHIMTLIWEAGFPVVYEVVDFHTPFEECWARNLNRAANPKETDSAAVPDEAMRRMLKTQQREIDRGLWTPEQIQVNLPVVEPYVPPAGKPKVYLFDIDGTLANTSHRSPYDFDRLSEDTLNEHVGAVYRALDLDGAVGGVIMSGRSEQFRPTTELWLDREGIRNYWDFFMRKEGDTRRDSVVKLELFNEYVRDNFQVIGAFDDRLRVCRIWHQIGIPVLRVGAPDDDF